MESLKRRCPACGAGVGMLVRISTVPGRNDVMTISLYCESCHYQWTIEDTDESDHSVQSKPEK